MQDRQISERTFKGLLCMSIDVNRVATPFNTPEISTYCSSSLISQGPIAVVAREDEFTMLSLSSRIWSLTQLDELTYTKQPQGQTPQLTFIYVDQM